MLVPILKKIFGTKSQRDLKKMLPLVAIINELEEQLQKLSEEELKNKTNEFKERLSNGETTEDIMCEAFAVVKNTCRRLCDQEITVCEQQLTWQMIPFDVQLMGAIALHRGNIAEMATGEGKTLVATMPLYLNALTGKNCQLVTVNDYLARRDSEWMGAVYQYLGLTVGCLQNMQQPDVRRDAYNCDITYGTNSEFGFDYLRDMGMATEAGHLVQREHFYAIVDEIDSILIDEARTPLIISGPVPVSTHQFADLQPLVTDLYQKQNHLCSRFAREAKAVLENEEASAEDREDAMIKLLQVKFGIPTHKQLMRILEDGDILKNLEKVETRVRSDNNRGLLQDVQSDLYFTIDEKSNEADLTEKGRSSIAPDDPNSFIMPDMLEEIHNIDTNESLDEDQRIEEKKKFQENFSVKSERLHDISQLLKAYCLFERDVHYVVQKDKVMIVDEHTGRLMPGRRFSDGLHQALEAKERVTIEQETQTLATITIQNYFRLYDKLAGMTGTAETEANEFHQIYKLDVIVIPTNRPCQRKNDNDSIFKTKREKFNAIVDEVEERYEKGQPVLLGTISVEDSEILSRMLKRNNVPHKVLNAKNHQGEAEIVAMAGQRGSVTVATNMAGRGTDIKLSEGVADLGGLHVIGSSRHDSRRIDRQLRGRCSRQGDPGTSKFYVSLEDNLMRLFGSDRIVKIFDRFGIEEGEELQHPWLNKSIETAQKRVEQHHFSIRKRTLEFDDVMNKQREIIYGLRKDALTSDKPQEVLFEVVEQVIYQEVMDASVPPEKNESNESKLFNWERLHAFLTLNFPIAFEQNEFDKFMNKGELADAEGMAINIVEKIEAAYEERNSTFSEDEQIWLQRHTVLDAIDRLWQEHLYTMDHLRSSIYLRAIAQKDPLVEYKNEAYKTFNEMMQRVYREVVNSMFKATITSLESFEEMLEHLPQEQIHEIFGQFDEAEFMGSPEQVAAAQIPEEMVHEEEEYDPIQVTFRRDMPKVGRNDPCPCGSGKKFKKCCGK
ncbi:MAG: preprotein translocase subunit SecA [Lentisphaerae bacterium]|nr:preprotein translocase subunit SecA [Lentisphaerota bacterium]MCP4101906.1 preprotein translocase subunit SecA [Lentisphaerota bacterium]